MSDIPTTDPEEDDDLDTPFDEDFPCIRCGYNLRGVPPKNNCPECGAPIQQSLDFAQETFLCPACMHPNHPSLAICRNCKTPISGAASTAGYFQTHATAARKKPPNAPPEPIPPAFLPTAILCFISMFALHSFAVQALDAATSFSATFFWCLTAVFVSLIIYLIAAFTRRTKKYHRQVEAYERILHPEDNDTPDANDATEPSEPPQSEP